MGACRLARSAASSRCLVVTEWGCSFRIVDVQSPWLPRKGRKYWGSRSTRRSLWPICDEEVEGCGVDPQHGDNLSGCKVWASWDVNGLYGHFECSGVPSYVEMQVEIQEVIYGGIESGTYKEFAFGEETWHNPTGETKWLLKASSCKVGKSYRGWVWMRTYYDKKTYWSASEIDHRLYLCEEAGGLGAGVEDQYYEPY